MMVLQKAVTPAMVEAYLTGGYDRVSGYMVRAAEVNDVTSVEDLRTLHVLDYEGSTFPASGPIHILHVDRAPAWPLIPATSKNVHERDALSTSGTVEVNEQLVEIFYLDHTRLTAGARLWRFEDDADPVLVGTYLGPASGWHTHATDTTKHMTPTQIAGSVVVLGTHPFTAQVTSGDDGVPTGIVAVAASEPQDHVGFAENLHGLWVREVRHSEARALFEMHVTAEFRDVPVQVVAQFSTPEGTVMARIVSLARNWEKSRDAGLMQVELGVWEGTVRVADLANMSPRELAPAQWMTPHQKKRLADIQAGRAAASAGRTPAGGAGQGPAADPGTPPGGRIVSSGLAPDVPPSPTDLPAGDGPAPGMITTPPGTGLSDAAHLALYQRIAQGTLPHAPKGSAEIRVLCEAVGNAMELSAQASDTSGNVTVLPTVSEDVARAFGELRALEAKPGEGTWYGVLVVISAKGELSLRFNRTDRPRFKRALTAEMVATEKKRFPRDSWPEWLAPEEGPATGD